MIKLVKLIASDMDGTLLDDKMEISAANVAAIKRAQAQGIEFLVATGREIQEAKPLVEKAGLKTGFISLNGARVFDTDGELIVDFPIPKATALEIEKLMKKDNFYFEIVTNQGVYSDSRINRIQAVADLLVALNPDTSYKIAVALGAARLELMNINYVENYLDILEDPKIEVMKFVVFDPHGPEAFDDLKHELEKRGDLAVTSSSPNNIEINDIHAQKGIALTDYAKDRGIAMQDVMAIGDNLNDESMIEAAGIGVAMGNAIPHIKALADYETAINTDDGVGQAIDHFLQK